LRWVEKGIKKNIKTKGLKMSIQELKDFLEKKADRELWTDDDNFNPMDFSGGNFDDAYYAGVSDGAASLAKTILKKYFTQQVNEADQR